MQTLPTSAETQRRRRYAAAFRQQVIEESFTSELSVARVAMKHGIKANLLHTWRWHYRREHGSTAFSSSSHASPAARLIPAFVASADQGRSHLQNPLSSAASPASHSLEVHLGSTRIVIGQRTDMALLRAVIQALQA